MKTQFVLHLQDVPKALFVQRQSQFLHEIWTNAVPLGRYLPVIWIRDQKALL